MKKIIIILLAIVALNSCKDSTQAQFAALGKHHIITLYGATGVPIKTWESTGGVSNETYSDGWYFEDLETGKLIEITGTIIIEVK